MNDTTTINIRTDQHEELEELKIHENESFADVVGRLLDAFNGDGTATDVDLAELQAQLDRIEDAANTAENRTGSIERQLEEMTR